MSGKGSRRRESALSPQIIQDNWDRIFGKKCDKKHCGGNVGDGTCYICKKEKRYGEDNSG